TAAPHLVLSETPPLHISSAVPMAQTRGPTRYYSVADGYSSVKHLRHRPIGQRIQTMRWLKIAPLSSFAIKLFFRCFAVRLYSTSVVTLLLSASSPPTALPFWKLSMSPVPHRLW